jgi:adenylate cyclase
MSNVFISYGRSTVRQARSAAAALRTAGYSVWFDEELQPHRAFSREIEQQLTAAKAALVIWSAGAAASDWVLSEANRAREERKLVQLSIDGARLPMPFDQIQCADLSGWTGDGEHPAWSKVVASIAELVGESTRSSAPVAQAPLPLPSRPSIAVLPFANLSGDSEQDYFADGVVEEITTALSRIRSIFVIASDSMLRFRGKAINPTEVARLFGVRYVLEGSVRKAGDRVRIAVRLLDGAEGAQVWAERFEDTLADIFCLQDEVALRVAGKIEPTIRETEIRRASGRSTDNLGAYDLFLRALPLWRPGTRDGALAALDLLHRAIDLEPDYAPALAVAAWCHSWLFRIGSAEEKAEHSSQAAELARRALQASRDDAEVLTYAADALFDIGGEMSVSLGLFEQAIAQNPGYAFAWLMSGACRVIAGETVTGVQHLETSIRMDPMTTFRAIQLCWLGVARFQERRFAEAANLLGQATTLLPNYFYSYAALAACNGHLGRRQAGLDALSQFRSLQPMTAEEVAYLFGAPKHRSMFLEGIALVEGEAPSENVATP